MEGNLVYNSVRETNDHGTYATRFTSTSCMRQCLTQRVLSAGPLNSWARTGFINVEGGGPAPSYAVLWNQIRNNMLVCGFSANQHGFAALDYDDGTEFMNSTENVLVYSGFKACWHSNNQHYADNLLIRPDLQAINGQITSQACASCTAGAPAPGSWQAQHGWMKNESFVRNTCIDNSSRPKVMHFGSCDSSTAFALNGTSVYSAGNSYYGQDIFECEKSYNLSGWQALWKGVGLAGGGEFGSTVVAALPTTEEIVAMAKSRLLPKRG